MIKKTFKLIHITYLTMLMVLVVSLLLLNHMKDILSHFFKKEKEKKRVKSKLRKQPLNYIITT